MGSPKAIRSPIWGSPEGLESQLSVFGTRFSVPFGTQESSTALDREKLYAKSVFSRGRRQWPQAISYVQLAWFPAWFPA